MIKSKLQIAWELIKASIIEFQKDNALHFAASLSFYTVFSLAPIIVIIVSMAGAFWGEAAVSGQIYGQLRQILGNQAALEIQEMVENASNLKPSPWAKLAGLGTLLFSATGVFSAIQDTLNIIWEVKPKPKSGFVKFLKDRLLSFAMILTISLILLVFIIINALVVAFADFIEGENISWFFLQFTNYFLSLAIITVLFALIFKVLPDAKIMWKDIWTGAIATAILFTIGKNLMSFYFANTNIGSAYGAAGSIVIVLIWVFYSSILLFLGAEFTQVYARMYGHAIVPREYAVKVETNIIEKSSEARSKTN